MSAVPDRVLSITKPTTDASGYMRIPLLGGLLVLANVGLAVLGVYVNWPGTCAFFAGLVNGTLLSIAAVALASERFQAGATGLLGGLSLSALRSDGSMVWKAMENLHLLIDKALHSMGFEVNERLHQLIGQEALYMVWTVVFVVLASLIAEWVRSARQDG